MKPQGLTHTCVMSHDFCVKKTTLFCNVHIKYESKKRK
jgi:hypothetical protein